MMTRPSIAFLGLGSALPERVRMLLMRRNLQRAQTGLASALAAFRESLQQR